MIKAKHVVKNGRFYSTTGEIYVWNDVVKLSDKIEIIMVDQLGGGVLYNAIKAGQSNYFLVRH